MKNISTLDLFIESDMTSLQRTLSRNDLPPTMKLLNTCTILAALVICRVANSQGFQATCNVLQGVKSGSIAKVFAPKEILRQVRRPGYYDPLGNMGRGEQRYYNQTVKEIKLVLISERAFVAGLRD